MKIAVSGQTLSEKYSLKETLEIIGGYGVKFIEIWPGNLPALSENVSKDSYVDRDVKEAKKLLEEYKIAVSAVSFSGAFADDLASDSSAYEKELCRAVEIAEELGAKLVNHYCYYLSLEQMDFAKLDACMGPALSLAKEKGIVLALENEAHDMTQTAKGMLEIVEHFADDHFKTTFDATNYYQAGEEGFPECYELLKEHIAYIHVKNGCVFDKDRGHIERFRGQKMTGTLEGKEIYYTPTTQGAVNMDGVIRRAKADGYDGFYNVEPHCPVDDVEMFLKQDLEYLLSM